MVEAIISYIAMLLLIAGHIFWTEKQNLTGTVQPLSVIAERPLSGPPAR
jgi:hypothetical protein